MVITPALQVAVTMGEKTESGRPGGRPNDIISSSSRKPPDSWARHT